MVTDFGKIANFVLSFSCFLALCSSHLRLWLLLSWCAWTVIFQCPDSICNDLFFPRQLLTWWLVMTHLQHHIQMIQVGPACQAWQVSQPRIYKDIQEEGPEEVCLSLLHCLWLPAHLGHGEAGDTAYSQDTTIMYRKPFKVGKKGEPILYSTTRELLGVATESGRSGHLP